MVDLKAGPLAGLCRCIAVILVAVLMAAVLLLASACYTKDWEGFALYLTSEEIPPSQMEALSHVDIAAKPLITTQDIISYNAATHDIRLQKSAFERIINLEVPVGGRSFLVCVNRAPVYWGAFWTPVSSRSFDGVTIWKPMASDESCLIRLELGYPGPNFYLGEDPRNNFIVMQALERAGKLKTALSATMPEQIPHSMKGYELYAWQKDSRWIFALITGTNRNKTLVEVTDSADIVTEDGWVRLQAVGMDAFKAVLSKMPTGEYIFWLDGLREESAQGAHVNIALPPKLVVDAVMEAAALRSLNLIVASH